MLFMNQSIFSVFFRGLRLSALSLGAWVTFGGQVKDEDAVFEIMRVAKEVCSSATHTIHSNWSHPFVILQIS
jgi:hypothetical protein